jgi:O-antigen/teichoic acid export membrane protein
VSDELVLPDQLPQRVVGGVMWKTTSAVVLQVSRLVTAIILARLLSPHAFGVAGMVLVSSGLVLIFADLAFGAALVQRRVLTEEDKSTVFWLNAVGGLVFMIGGILLSGPVARFFGEPAVQPLFAVYSTTFFVTALSATQSALLNREMNFRSLELRQMTSYAAGAVVGIVVAFRGGGAWAIILQQVTIAVVSTVLLTLMARWRPRFVFSKASLDSMVGFSGRVFGTRLLFYVNRNADNLLIGRFVGPAALGVYALAYNVMMVPFSQISNPIQAVLFPAFSRLQDDPERIGRGWLRVNRAVAAITMPALLGLVVVAPDFVVAILGDRWRPAIPVVQILCWVGILQSLQGMNSSILEARDRTPALLRYAVIVCVASLTAFVLGVHWGVVGVAAGYAISSTIVEPYFTLITARSIDMRLTTFLASLRGVAEAAVAMALIVFVVRMSLTGASPGLRLAVSVAVGALVYVPLCSWRAPELVRELRAVIPRRRAVSPADARPSEQ